MKSAEEWGSWWRLKVKELHNISSTTWNDVYLKLWEALIEAVHAEMRKAIDEILDDYLMDDQIEEIWAILKGREHGSRPESTDNGGGLSGGDIRLGVGDVQEPDSDG